jgi:hypothetical protein
MKQSHLFQKLRWLRIVLALLLGALGGYGLGFVAGLAVTATLLLISPFHLLLAGTSPYPGIGGSSKAQLTPDGSHAEEMIWEQEIVQSAFQQSPFSDNMVGRVGSGKPIIEHTNTKVVGGQSIVVSTVDSLGAPIIQGNATRVGNEEQIKPGDFLLQTSIGFISAGIDNTGLTQTIIGKSWNRLTQTLLARRLAKQQNDDRLQALKLSATADNTVFPNGKTLDTLSSADTFQTSLVVKASGLAKDLGAIPMNAAPNPDSASATPPPIQRYMQFLTDVGARPIKTEPAYLQGLSYAGDRGKDNPLFTGDYQEWDNNIVYPWVNVRHGGYGPIGSALQPEALLGTAIQAKGTSATLPTAATLDGGGSNTAASVMPLRNYFENFSRFAYTPINGVKNPAQNGGSDGSFTPRATYGYCAIVDKAAGQWSFFRYATNGGNTLTGVSRLGSSTTGDYVNPTLGGVTWGTAPYLTTADGNGYLGISEGAVAPGSVIYETNSKGVPLCFGLCLGEMALVEGYGRVPVNGGASFKTMVNRVDYTAPYGQAFGRGLEVAWGCAAFKRPDGITPNYVLEVFARNVPGFPIIP